MLTGDWLIIVLAYMVRKLPFSVRSAGAILHQIDPSLEEASINLGVPPALTFLRITVPLMLGGIVGGFVLTFVTVASELCSTVVLYSGPWTTMTVAMFQALEGTSPGIAAAAATVLIICTRAAGGAGLSPAAAARTIDALTGWDSHRTATAFCIPPRTAPVQKYE